MTEPTEIPTTFKAKVYKVVFESDTTAGRAFDAVVIWSVILSVAAVLAESLHIKNPFFAKGLFAAEWFFTILFTIEYAVRLYCLENRWRYVFSFFGIIDLLAVLPTYLALIFPGAQALAVFRVFRVLRLFRVFKLVRYMKEARILALALSNAKPKIVVFMVTLSGIVISMGALMYLVEGESNGFTSIPKGIYWAVITLTTVGYGDLVPKTPLGQALATVIMVLGYAIIAVPTGIMSVEIGNASRSLSRETACKGCGQPYHESDALYCRLCGHYLAES